MVDILDHRGNKLEKQALKEPQTAKIASLHQEFASHPTRGLSPQRLAQIMEEAERGDIKAQSDLFEDIEEKDGHVMAELGKRKRALLGLNWAIEPPNNPSAKEQQIAEQVEEIISGIANFEDVLLNMADGIGNGYSCLEYEWMRGSYWMPQAIHHRPPRWFQIAPDNHNELRLRNNNSEGDPLWPAGWIVHIHKSKSGDLSRAGLHRALVWPFLFKNYSVRDLAEFLEIYGLPVRLGKYPSGASENEKMTLLKAVVNMGHAAAGIIPEGMMVDFMEAAKGGSDPYQAMIDWCERTQSKVILGGTLTSQADGASSTNALGNVHNEVRRELTVSDAMQIAGTLTRDLVQRLCQLNGWIVDPLRLPRFVFDTVEAEDLALYAEAIPKLVDVGLPIGVEYLQDKLRIPAPEEGEAILGRVAITPSETEQAALKGAAAAAQKPDTVDRYVEQLDKTTEPLMNELIEPVRNLVMKADSLEAVRDGLLDLYADMEPTELGNVIQQALVAAELSGRFEANDS